MGWFREPWTLQDELLARAGCSFVKDHVFLARCCFGVFDDFGWFWEAFWEPKCYQNGLKIGLKNCWIFGSLLEGLWGAKSALADPKSARTGSMGRPILKGAVKTLGRVWPRKGTAPARPSGPGLAWQISENEHAARARARIGSHVGPVKTDSPGLVWLPGLAWPPWPLLASLWPLHGLSLASLGFPLASLWPPLASPWPRFGFPLASL